MTATAADQQEGLLLTGLDGANPLGFLAALGVLRVVDVALGSRLTRMRWTPGCGTWIPELIGSVRDQESLLNLLTSTLRSTLEQHPLHVLDTLDKLDDDDPSSRFDLFTQQVQDASIVCRDDVQWLAALASDIISSSAINQLQTTRRDYYYGNLTSIIRETTTRHLRRALFSPWDYADPLDNQSLHLDPSEDRRHAHQWNKPAGDPNRKRFGGMLGANRLALEALVLFTSLPYGDALQTIGFTGQRSHDTRWTWPIWDVPLGVPEVCSALTMPELQSDSVSVGTRERLSRRGIAAVFRTHRILVGKTPNFTPAQGIA